MLLVEGQANRKCLRRERKGKRMERTHIRTATEGDLSRIAEIFVINNRVNYWPIFGDEAYSFGQMQVLPMAEMFRTGMDSIAVYDDGIVRGFVQTAPGEVEKLYVDPFFQGRGIGAELLAYAMARGARRLWALEKNTRALAFYARHGFRQSGAKKLEEGTTEFLVLLTRQK